jgi:hypothetical protein
MKFYIEEATNSYYWRKILNNKLNAIYFSKSVWFFKSGKHHNFKNAAYTSSNKYKVFYLNGIHYGNEKKFTKQSWRKFVRELKLKTFL